MKFKFFGKRTRIIIYIVAALFGVTLAIVYFNLGSIIKANKDLILAQVETAVGREVAAEELDVNFLGGIGVQLTKVSVADDPQFSKENLLEAKELLVHLKLWPLLRKQIEISQLILNEPVINIVRNQEGNWNLIALGESLSGEKDEGAAPAEGDNKDVSSSKSSQSLSLSLFRVKNGALHVRDLKDNGKLDIEQADLNIKDFQPDRPFTIQVSCAVLSERQNISMEGKIGPLTDTGPIPLDGEITIDPLSVGKITAAFPFIKTALPEGIPLPETAKFNAAFSGNSMELTLPTIEVSGNFFQSKTPNITITGDVGPVGADWSKTGAHLKLALKAIPLEALKKNPLLSDSIPENLSAGGSLSGVISAEGTLGKIQVTGELDGKDTSLEMKDLFQKPAGMPLTIKMNSNLTENKLAIENVDLKVHDLALKGKGDIGFEKAFSMNLSLESPAIETSSIPELVPLLKTYKPSGPVSLTAQIQQGAKPLTVTGALVFNKVRAEAPQLPSPITDLTGNVDFTLNTVSMKEASLSLGQSKVNLTAQVRKLDPLNGVFTVQSSTLHLKDLYDAGEDAADPGALNDFQCQGNFALVKESITSKGTIASKKGVLHNAAYTDLKATYEFADQILNVRDLALQTMDGTIEGTLTYNLQEPETPKFDVSTQVKNIDLAALLRTQFSFIPKEMKGHLNFDGNISGAGSEWESIQKTLAGMAKAEILDGVMLDTNVASETMKSIVQLPMLSNFLTADLEKQYPTVFASEQTAFDLFKASLNIKQGDIQLTELLLTAADWALNGDGLISAKQELTGSGVFNLSKTMSTDLIQRVKEFRYLTNDQGQVAIPLSWRGALSSVRVLPDQKALTSALQSTLINTGLEKAGLKGIDNLIPGLGKNKTSASATPEVQSSTSAKTQPKSPLDLVPKGLGKLLKKQ